VLKNSFSSRYRIRLIFINQLNHAFIDMQQAFFLRRMRLRLDTAVLDRLSVYFLLYPQSRKPTIASPGSIPKMRNFSLLCARAEYRIPAIHELKRTYVFLLTIIAKIAPRGDKNLSIAGEY
jgi:hypothetical protein